MQQSMKSQKNALDWKARKKETLISISTGLRILPKSITFLVFLFFLCHRPQFDLHSQFTSHMNLVIDGLKFKQDPSPTQKSC